MERQGGAPRSGGMEATMGLSGTSWRTASRGGGGASPSPGMAATGESFWSHPSRPRTAAEPDPDDDGPPIILCPLRDAIHGQAKPSLPGFVMPKRRYVAKSTESSRLMREVGLSSRHGTSRSSQNFFSGGSPAATTMRSTWTSVSGSEAPLSPPVPPPYRPPPAPKALAPWGGSRTRISQLRDFEEVGGSTWPTVTESKSVPNLSSASGSDGSPLATKHTWTSGLRELRLQTSRAAAASKRASGAEHLREMPKHVRDWAAKRQEEFADRGFSIGARFATVTTHNSDLTRHDPSIGSMSRWDSEAAFPTKQVCAQHPSSVAHTMGARRADPVARQRAQETAPGPGTYDSQPGFADELLKRLSKSQSPTAGGSR